jgi:hypothetical protein
MSGYADLNFPAFHKEAAAQRAAGYEVINPAELNPEADAQVIAGEMTAEEKHAHWVACMRKDIQGLLSCDRVVLLPGWRASRGASLERHIAEALGYEIVFGG